MIRKRFPWIAAAISLLTAVAYAQQPGKHAAPRPAAQPKSQFLRLLRTAENRPLTLDTAIVRYAAADHRQDGPTVDLVAALHVAEKGYYDQLNREFAGYDVVLYELIAPQGTRVPKGTKGGGSTLSTIQIGMKDLLKLEFQLQQIDYTRGNMVHADMSPEQLAQSMKNRDDFLAMFFRLLGYALAKQGQGSDQSTEIDLLAALFDKNRALALKRVMAEQFEDMEGELTAMEGPQGSTLISQRNKVALDVLRKQLAAGKRKIAIFYGAGHMSDMQKRLRSDFGLVPVSTRWLAAWDLKGDRSEKVEKGKKGEKRSSP
jgi:hypothetical protein